MSDLFRYDQCVHKSDICSAVKVRYQNADEVVKFLQCEVTISTNKNGLIKEITFDHTSYDGTHQSLTAKNGQYIVKDDKGIISLLSSSEFEKDYRYLTHA